MQLVTVYEAIKKKQEEEENLSHLRVLQMVLLAICLGQTGSSIYNHFNKKFMPSVINYMGLSNSHAVQLYCGIPLNMMINSNIFLFLIESQE